MENNDSEGVRLLAPLRDLPVGDVRVDMRAAVARGRRRYWMRRALQSTAVAGFTTAVVITSVILAGGRSADTRPEPNASGSGPAPTAAVPAATASPPSSCEVSRLFGPSGSSWAYATDVDPTGRFIVGREYSAGGQPQAVLWDGGVPRPIPVPGDDPSPAAVNGSGVAVGVSILAGTEAAWVYLDGTVKQLRGGNSATLIGETGRIVGYRYDGVAEAVAVVWDTPESDPVDLAAPEAGWRVFVASIAPDGTVVGSVTPPDDDTGLREEGYLWHPDGTVTRLPAPSVPGRTVTGFRAYVLEPDSIVGTIAFQTPDGDVDYRLVRVDRRTGIATEYPEAAHRMRLGGPFNQRGWYAGSVGFPNSTPAVGSPAGRLDLPVDPNLTDQAALSISDDGSIIVGRGYDESEQVYQAHALVWHCQ